MVQIPEFQESEVLPNRPLGDNIPVNEYGRDWEAAARVGGQVADFSTKLIAARQEAEAKDYAFSKAMQDRRDLADYTEKLKLDPSMGQDLKGYSDSVQKWTSDRFVKNQDGAPSDLAKRFYQDAAGGFMNEGAIKAEGEERQARAVSYETKFDQDTYVNADSIVSNPNIDYAHDLIELSDKRAGDSRVPAKDGTPPVWDAEQSVKKRDFARNVISEGFFKGLYDKGIGDTTNGKTFLQNGISYLNGTDTYTMQEGADITSGGIASYLKPNQKAELLKQFEDAMKQHTKASAVDLNNRIQDYKVQQFLGKPADSTLPGDIISAVNSHAIPMEHAVREFDDFNESYAAGQMTRQIERTGPDQWDGIMSGHDKAVKDAKDSMAVAHPELKALNQPGFNAQVHEQYKAKVEAFMDQSYRARNTDPVGFVTRVFPNMDNLHKQAGSGDPAANKTYFSQLLTQEQSLGVKPQYQRILSKDETSGIATALGSANEKQVATQLNSMEQRFGPYFSRAFSEIASDNKSDGTLSKLWVATFVHDPYARERMVGNIINQNQIDKAFAGHNDKASVKDLHEAVNSASSPYFQAIIGKSAAGGSIEQANAFNEVVETDAKNLLLQNPRLSAGDAAKQALTQLSDSIGVSTNANSPVVYPKMIEGRPVNPKLLDSFKATHLNRDAFQEMGVHVPTQAGNGLTIEEQTGNFYDYLEKNAQWKSSGSGDSIYLAAPDSRTGKETPILDKNGHMVIQRIQDINDHPDKRTLDGTKSLLDKFWGLFHK